MQAQGVINAANPVSCERLSRVNFTYVDFSGATAEGNVVVLDAVAEQVQDIFSALLTRRFPLNKSVVMENYQGDDQAAMQDNNTSVFNGRFMTRGGSWSKHAYGVAIDINPIQNPYIAFADDGSAKILPSASAKSFVNRHDMRPGENPRPGMAESIIDIFSRHGFMTWGDDWDSPIDYQHFEIGTRTFLRSCSANQLTRRESLFITMHNVIAIVLTKANTPRRLKSLLFV